MPGVAIAPILIVVDIEEVEAAGMVGIALVGRGTPIEAEPTNVATRRPVAGARSRKKDTIAIGSRYLIAVYTTLGGPCPCAVIF